MGRRSRNNGSKKKLEVEKINTKGEDKFTDLPDPFFYRIISLLQLDDFARVATLSKKFRNRCFFETSLEINLSLPKEEEEKEEKKKLNEENPRRRPGYSSYGREKVEKKEKWPPLKKKMYDNEERRSFLISVLDKVMSLRNKDMNSLNIPWYRFEAEQVVHLNRWIQTAATCNIKNLELDLALEKGQCIEFPRCESLRVFKLKLYDGTLKLLSEGGFSSLRVLTLESVRIICGDFGELISSSKCLQTLSLKQCFGVEKIEIESSSLQEISIMKTNSDELKHIKVSANGVKTINVAWYFRKTSEDKSFHLSAPSLRSLTWKGDSVNDCNLGSFISLQDACLNLRHPSMLTEYQSSLEQAPIEDSLIELIKSVRGVRSLELNCWHVEGLVEQNHQLTSFDNLQDLILNASAVKKDRQVPAILRFLKLLPNLQSLHIRPCRQPWGWAANLGKAMVSDKSSSEWISHLKHVEIELVGGADEIELIEYISNYAKELKKLIILYSKLDLYRLTELSNKIKRAHSRGVVLFLPFVDKSSV